LRGIRAAIRIWLKKIAGFALAGAGYVRPRAGNPTRVVTAETQVPRVYRVMEADQGRPAIGQGPVSLGVRVAGKNPDVSPEGGFVFPGGGGMSVAPSLRELPEHRIPRRLRHLVPEARGKDTAFVWRMGEGPFGLAPVAARLQLRPDAGNIHHGVIEPNERMRLEKYEQALAGTQDKWTVEEQ
jgi:hypothetical protein